MKDKLKLLALRLKKYKAYCSDNNGHMERALIFQEEETMNKIGDMLFEILQLDEEETEEQLKEEKMA